MAVAAFGFQNSGNRRYRDDKMSVRSHSTFDAATDAPALPAGCRFDPTDWYLLARGWYPVLEASRAVREPATAMLLDQPLVLYRVGAQIVIARDACPHRGIPLSMGKADDTGIRCAYHGLRFGADGRCTDIPSQPGHPIPHRLHLDTFPAVERYGLVWTCLWPDSGSPPDIPVVPLWDAPGVTRTVCPRFSLDCFAGRQIEGFLDVAHFAWVHSDTFADPDQAEVPGYQVHPTDTGFRADYHSQVGNYPRACGSQAPEGFVWHRRFDVHLPFAASLTIHFPADEQLVVANFASPASTLRTELFAPIVQTFNTDQPVEEIHAFNLRVFEEDRRLAEAQRPRNLPLAVRDEAHIPADRSSLAYRRALAKRGHGRFFNPCG